MWKKVKLVLVWSALSRADVQVELSEPVWLLPPEQVTGVLSSPLGIDWKTSKNNVAITYAQGRLYAAVRTADHHHPRPPSMGPYFLNRKLDLALRYLDIPGGLSSFLPPIPKAPNTRLYVFSAEVSLKSLRELSLASLASLSWRLEFEAHDKWSEAVASLLRGGPSREQEISDMLGREEAERLTSSNSDEQVVNALIKEPDLREPLFLHVGNRLIFYFVAIEGEAQKFNPLRTFAVSRNARGEWGPAVAVLDPKELLWEVKSVAPTYYATSYLGGHYQEGDQLSTRVLFKRSLDGIHWQTVGSRAAVYEGGANEAGFEFDAKGNLWSVLRLDDGDSQKGWGSLLGFAPKGNLGDWKFPTLADPRRFDSPRFFRSGSELFLVARQNIIAKHEGNAPYDLSFVGRSIQEGEKRRVALLNAVQTGAEFNKGASVWGLMGHLMGLGTWIDRKFPIGVFYEYEFSYWGKYPKRTAVYHLNTQKRNLDLVATLPSAGDTAFPSIVNLSENEFLIANYSSPFDKQEWSWGIGQKNPTGIYLIKLKVRH